MGSPAWRFYFAVSISVPLARSRARRCSRSSNVSPVSTRTAWLPVAASKRRTITFGVERIELDAAVDATGLVGRDEGRARAKERVDDVAAVGEIEKGGLKLLL